MLWRVALSELDPTGRFGDRANDYVKYRPSYPAAAVDAVLAGLGAPASLHAADIGAGTGISARLLGDRGVRVIAVEPNAPMRDAATPHPNVTFHDGTAEATGLADGAFDLVLCAQSFHWFRPEPALNELARILRPPGRLALMWNRRSQSDPFTAGYRDAILAASGESAAERMEFDPALVPRSRLFSALSSTSVPNAQRLDLSGLIGRAQSASYVPKHGPNAERLLELLRALHERHADPGGCVTLVYETEVHVCERLI
jgi:SAM-dependent methyltransferase